MIRKLMRLLVAILLPALIASLVFVAISIIVENYRLKDRIIMFLLYMIYGSALWAIPGVCIWLITESLWTRAAALRHPARFVTICGCLGLAGGLLLIPIGSLIWNWNLFGSRQSYVLFAITGAFATAISAWPLMKLQK